MGKRSSTGFVLCYSGSGMPVTSESEVSLYGFFQFQLYNFEVRLIGMFCYGNCFSGADVGSLVAIDYFTYKYGIVQGLFWPFIRLLCFLRSRCAQSLTAEGLFITRCSSSSFSRPGMEPGEHIINLQAEIRLLNMSSYTNEDIASHVLEPFRIMAYSYNSLIGFVFTARHHSASI